MDNRSKPIRLLFEAVPDFGVFMVAELMQRLGVREFSFTREQAAVIEGDSGDAWVRRFCVKISDDEETLTVMVRDQ